MCTCCFSEDIYNVQIFRENWQYLHHIPIFTVVSVGYSYHISHK